MGIDCTVMVLSDYNWESADRVRGFVDAVFSLHREGSLWDKLRAIPTIKRWDVIQLPRGSWATYQDGTSPPDQNGRELGWLVEDSYGARFRSCLGVAFLGIESEYPRSLNTPILRFIAEHYGDRHVVLFWH